MTAGNLVVLAGVDIGSSAIKLSHLNRDGKLVRLEDSSGNHSFDSSVHVKGPNAVVFGEEARRLSFEDPANFVPDLKAQRGTGKTYHGLSVSDLLQLDLETRLLKAFVEQFGVRPTHVALTIPCDATDKHIADLVSAYRRAGLEVLATIQEPCGVALAAASSGAVKATPGQHFLVVDTGHLSTDGAVVHVKPDGTFIVTRAAGLTGHAGEKLLGMVSDFVLSQASKQAGTKITRADLNPEQLYTHMSEVFKAVRALSSRPSVTVAVLLNKKVVAVEIKTAVFKEILDEFLKPVVALLNKLLVAAGLEPSAIAQLLVSGGLSVNGLFRDRLAAAISIPSTRVPEPLDACARGAAIHAQALAHRELPEATKELPPAEAAVTLCTTHTIAVVIAERGPAGERIPACSLLVGEGSPIPVRGEKLYSLMYADQPGVTISIVRGKEGQPPHQCEKFGEFELKNLPPEKLKTPRIRVEFAVNERNLCELTARDLISGVSHTISFDVNKAGAK